MGISERMEADLAPGLYRASVPVHLVSELAPELVSVLQALEYGQGRCRDWAKACRGNIASSRGSAIVAPKAPRMNVRRERCFFVMNMITVPSLVQLG